MKKQQKEKWSETEILKLLECKCEWTIRKRKISGTWFFAAHIPKVGEMAALEPQVVVDGILKRAALVHGWKK